MASRTGSVKKHRGVWTARVTYTDPVTGKRREIRHSARNKAEAAMLRDEMLRRLRESEGRDAGGEPQTLAELADHYTEHYVQPAEYREGRKVAGLRSHRSVRGYVSTIRERLGRKRLRGITYGNLRGFRNALLSDTLPQKLHGQDRRRSIANVNRILATLRRMLSIAQREGWITQNPFAAGEPLITLADEKRRERILTRDEEQRLLAACSGAERAHLRPLLICALDTGMRQGEMLKLQWKDVDLDARMITIQATHTKTQTARQVPITERLRRELVRLATGADPDARVFGITDNVKRSFTAARRAAKLPDLRFHDLRHTAATRLAQGHMPLFEVGRILGHSEPKTTFRYTNTDATTFQRAVAILESFGRKRRRAQTTKQKPAERSSAAVN